MGRRNYRFFYAFILSLSFLTAFIFACVVTHLTLRELGVRAAGEWKGPASKLKGQQASAVTVPLSLSSPVSFSPGAQGSNFLSTLKETPARYPLSARGHSSGN